MIILAGVSFLQSFVLFPFLPFFFWSLVVSIVVAVAWYAVAHVQYAIGLPGYSFLQTLHLTSPKMQFYDKHLDNAVWYARHALSIDENKADFARVEWGSAKTLGRKGQIAIPIGSTKSGSPACIPTSAEVTLKTNPAFPISRLNGWCMPP
jgi:hypothetical protein